MSLNRLGKRINNFNAYKMVSEGDDGVTSGTVFLMEDGTAFQLENGNSVTAE
jgi:hypothetical protein